MIHNFGKVHPSSHRNKDSYILNFLHDDLHNSFVTLRIDASDIAFVKNVGSGRIVETYMEEFTARQGHGILTVEVKNTGEVLAEYSLTVKKCNRGLHQIGAKSVTIEAAELKNTTFKIRATNNEGGEKECEGTFLIITQLHEHTHLLAGQHQVV